MYKLCRVDIGKSKEIYKRIEEFANYLRQSFPISKIVLFGGFARGDVNEGSDIDLLIVGDLGLGFFERIGKVLELTDLPVEPWVYTEEEFNEMIESGNTFVMEVLERGKEI